MGDLGSATVQEATLAVAVQGLKYAVENGTVDELSNSFSGTKICDFEDTPLRIRFIRRGVFFLCRGFQNGWEDGIMRSEFYSFCGSVTDEQKQTGSENYERGLNL